MKKELVVFLSVCFGLSIASALAFRLLGGQYASVIGSLFASGYMLIPIISVIITQLILKEKVLSNIGFNFKLNKWWFIAWLGMPVFTVGALLLSAIMPGTELSGETPIMLQQMEALKAQGLALGPWGIFLITLMSAYAAGLTINAVFAFGEEAAWRGYLIHVLDDMGFWNRSLLIGFIWGIWHAPIILMGHNYPQHPVAGVFMMIAFCIMLTPIMNFFREKSGSAVVAAIAHGVINATAGVSLMYLTTQNDLLYGATGLAGFLVLIVLDLCILAYQKRTHSI